MVPEFQSLIQIILRFNLQKSFDRMNREKITGNSSRDHESAREQNSVFNLRRVDARFLYKFIFSRAKCKKYGSLGGDFKSVEFWAQILVGFEIYLSFHETTQPTQPRRYAPLRRCWQRSRVFCANLYIKKVSWVIGAP